MFDIAELLFPNLFTLLTQLAATGVLFVLYKKYLHEPVLKLLDQKAEDFESVRIEAEKLHKEQAQSRLEFEKEREATKESFEKSRQLMLDEIETTRQTLMQEAENDIRRLRLQAQNSIEKEKLEMLKDVEKEVLELAAVMVEKVLEDFTFDETQMLQALEKEMNRAHVRS